LENEKLGWGLLIIGKLERKGWSCNVKLASERLQESQVCPPHVLRGPGIPSAASRKTSPSLGERAVLAFRDWQRVCGEFLWQSLLLHLSMPSPSLDTPTYMQAR